MIRQRAFASKLIRDSNVDVRLRLAKLLSSASSSPVLTNDASFFPSTSCSDHSTSSTPTGPSGPNSNGGGGVCTSTSLLNCSLTEQDETACINYYCDTPINDVVDSVDYEDYIASNSARIPSHLKSVLIFPNDDILVDKYQPPLRTLEPTDPEFNNVQTSEDPYIQSIGSYTPKSLLVTKKYEKCPSVVGLSPVRKAQTKELKRQEYEIDLAPSADDYLLDSPSTTPNTFYSRCTSVRNTPRPQSLISTTSTIRPPLASDEEDYSDDADHHHNNQHYQTDKQQQVKTPLASDCDGHFYLGDTVSRDNVSINELDNSSIYGDSRNSWMYTDCGANFDRFNSMGSKTKGGLFSLQNSRSDPHIQGILENNFYNSYFDNLRSYYNLDSKDNQILPIFCLHPLQSDDEQIESRASVPPPSDVPRYRFQIRCLSLKFELSIEPIFASIAIYDAKERIKVTENFYFDMNSESSKRLLRSHISYQDLSTLSRSAIFSLSQLTSDMFLVIKLEKVLQNDINDVIDAYARPPDDQSKLEKMKVSAASNCERLGKYRMPFAWAAVPLVNILSNSPKMCETEPVIPEGDQQQQQSRNNNNSSSLDSLKRIASECTPNFVRKGSLERHSTLASGISNFSAASASSNNSTSSNTDKRFSTTSEDLVYCFEHFNPVIITNKIFYRHECDKFGDDDLYKFLSDWKRANYNIKRLRCIPGIIRIDIRAVTDESSIKCRVNPELVRLHPYVDDGISPMKELLEFRDLLIPHFEHRNLLYVYPRSVNLTNCQGSSRNISIKIQLLSSEEKYSAIPVIFGKSSCPEMLTEAYTAVNYHNRNPNFNEEFKIRLPSKLSKQTHLLFTFIHVRTKPKSDTPVDEIVGYTWLPLWRDDCLQTGNFSLPILVEMPTPGYSFLTPNVDSLPNVKWIDNHKPLFVVHLDSYSSIFSQDPHIDRFFRSTAGLDNQVYINSQMHSKGIFEEFSNTISGLTQSNTDSLVKFIHLILNRLILLMIRPPKVFSGLMKANFSKSVQTLIFDTMIVIVSKINAALYADYSSMRTGIMSSFIQYQAVFPQPEVRYMDEQNCSSNDAIYFHARHSSGNNKTVEIKAIEVVSQTFHEEIVQQWLMANDTIRDNAFENANFLFDIIFKSLCVHLSLNNIFMLSPRNRLSKPFLTGLNDLVVIIGDFVVSEMKQCNQDSSSTPSSPQSTGCQTLHLQNLNQSFAFFVRDLISVLDRHFVFNLIKSYIRKLSISLPTSNSFSYPVTTDSALNTSRAISDGLLELRIDFLRVLCGHEHFVALNLPFGTALFTALEQTASESSAVNSNPSFSPSSSFAKVMLNSSIFSHSFFDRIRPYAELTDDYRRQHWLLGLVFCTMVDSFTKPKTHLQLRSANLLRSILTSLDWDSRYKDSQIKSRISCLFFPLIGIMIDVISQLFDPFVNKENPFYSAEENKKYAQKSKELCKSYFNHDSSGNGNSIGMAIAGSAVRNEANNRNSLPSSPQHNRHTLSYQPINEETSRILLSCFLWVIGNVDQRLFRRYLSEFSNERFLAFLELLRLSMRVYEYQGETLLRKNSRFFNRRQSYQKLEDVIRYGTARRELMRRRDFSQSFGASDNSEMKYRWRKDSTISRYNSLPRGVKVDMEDDIVLEGYLCTMANYIVIDTISLILSIIRNRISNNPAMSSPHHISSMINSPGCNLKNKYACDEFIVGSALQALLQLLTLNQSTSVLEAIFHCQRSLLHHFPDLLFIEGLPDIEFCSELCYLLLKHCGSRVAVIRAQAAASMYLLMRQNYQSAGNFSRIKIQITMSLSQLVGTSRNFNEGYIRRALKSILMYAISDSTVKETQFPEQVHELVFNLHMILSDTIKMKEHDQDPEMLLDLMYRVAKGYQNSPELRLTWLQNMAQKHADLSQHVEAAQCYVHASALVSECLNRISPLRQTFLPISCVVYQRVCPNVFEENLNSNADLTIDKTNISSGNFTSASINSKKSVRSAKLFSETGLVSLLEKSADYFHVGGMFEAVNETYKLLIPIHEAHHRFSELAKVHGRLQDVFLKIEQHEGKRVFPTYFRVGFYGMLFGDLDREEFVYKEPFLTKLPEISHRLESFYGNRFGEENVEVIKDSNLVDSTKLNCNKAHIQITYVEPYFDSWELESRHTCFERNYNLKRFIYSTPFTLDGRAHGQLYEQCKRKTILTTSHAFPYVKTRVQVQDRQQLVLSPIEVAIEDVQKKTTELEIATHHEPVDAKILQMVLQGCVGTTVNQGPAEIAIVFLSEQPNIPANCQRPVPALQNKLRSTFKEFSDRCGEALKKNRQMVGCHEQQIEYHKELERNFYTFTERLSPLMGMANSNQALVMLREAYFSGYAHSSSSSLNNNNNNNNDNVDNNNSIYQHRMTNGLTTSNNKH